MKNYYSVKEAANLISVSTNTLYSYLDSGAIKSQRIGKGRFKIPYSELTPYLEPERNTSKKSFFKLIASYFIVAFFAIATTIAVFAYFFMQKPNVLGVSTVVQDSKQQTESETKIRQTPAATTIPLNISKSNRFAIYNGSGILGTTATIEGALKSLNLPDFKVTARAFSKESYDNTIIIDLSGKRGEEATALAKQFKIAVSLMPEGETKPDDADFLLIVGKNVASESATKTP